MLSLALAFVSLYQTSAPPQALSNYLNLKQPEYGFEAKSSSELILTSQKWQGLTWKHSLLFQQPQKLDHKGIAILFITGDRRDPDGIIAAAAANSSGMPVAMLFDVPNQPLFDRREDDLIAHTIQAAFTSGDDTWPLLFPMTNSAIKAMDAIEAHTKSSSNPIKKFVVTGASKRGWTTWLVGASGDKRVLGIAPMVIDNLNLEKQMKHQLDTWGKYSPMIDDYTRRGLQQLLADKRGKQIAEMIDPYSYKSQLSLPKLIVNGANDEYWTVDALSQYWDELNGPKWARLVPNAGHSLGDGRGAMESVSAFARSLAGEFPMPNLTWSISNKGKAVTVEGSSKGLGFYLMRIWTAESDTKNFVDSKWKEGATLTVSDVTDTSRAATVSELPPAKNVAFFVEFRYKVKGREFSLTSPAKIVTSSDVKQ